MTSTIDQILQQFQRRFTELGEDTQGRLLRGVALAIAEHGASQTTVQHILDAAGISRRTFYMQFENKDDALDALFRTISEGFVSAVEGLIAEVEDPVEAAVRVCDLYLSMQLRTGKAALAMYAEATRPDSRIFSRREALISTLSELLARRFSAHIGQPVDPWRAHATLLGIEGVIIHLKRSGQLDESCRERLRALTRSLIASP